MRHHDATKRTRQVACCEDAEGLHQPHPLGHVRREEQRAHRGREEHEDHEVVELQRAAQCGQRQGLDLGAGERAGRMFHPIKPRGFSLCCEA